MKVLWDTEDAIPGRVVKRPGIRERYIICYKIQALISKNGNTYGLCSLADGMIVDIGTQAEVAAHLTKHEYVPYEYNKHRQVNEYLEQ